MNDPSPRTVRHRRRLGAGPEQVARILQRQAGVCAICRNEDPGWRGAQWHLDHDHETGQVRGLLCRHCNMLLGFARDNPVILQSAAFYLRTHRLLAPYPYPLDEEERKNEEGMRCT